MLVNYQPYYSYSDRKNMVEETIFTLMRSSYKVAFEGHFVAYAQQQWL